MTKPRAPREAGPLEQLEALERELASGRPLARAWLVRGDEGYFRETALRAIGEAAQRAGFELARHDAADPDFSLRGLCDDLGAPAMFAPARCVFLRRATRLVRDGDSGSSVFLRAALAFLAGKSLPGTLVLEAPGLRADHALAKAVAQCGGQLLTLRKLYETPPPWDPDPRKVELVQWLSARAAKLGVPLTREEAVFVVAATGNDLAALEGQLDRIAHRGEASLRSVVPWSSGGSPFQVAEQLLLGDASRALLGLEALFRGGFQGKEGGRETDSNALVAILLGSLRSRLSATLRALQDPAAEAPGNPREREELAARLAARSPAGWQRFAEQFFALERRARAGGGSIVDLDELASFALRTRVERRPQAARSAR